MATDKTPPVVVALPYPGTFTVSADGHTAETAYSAAPAECFSCSRKLCTLAEMAAGICSNCATGSLRVDQLR